MPSSGSLESDDDAMATFASPHAPARCAWSSDPKNGDLNTSKLSTNIFETRIGG